MHEEYDREEVKRWGRQVLRARNSGTFAETIFHEIAQSDLTIDQIAEACDTTRGSVNKWKAKEGYGECYPNVCHLWALTMILHNEVNVIGAYLLYTKKIYTEKKSRCPVWLSMHIDR